MYNIDDIYNGFSDTLLLYENRLLDINKRFQDKVESNLTVQYSSFWKEVLGKDVFCYKKYLFSYRFKERARSKWINA